MNLTDKELEALKATKSETEWNATCLEIKTARSGQYPPDWWAKVMTTGLAQSIAENWAIPGTAEIKIG